MASTFLVQLEPILYLAKYFGFVYFPMRNFKENAAVTYLYCCPFLFVITYSLIMSYFVTGSYNYHVQPTRARFFKMTDSVYQIFNVFCFYTKIISMIFYKSDLRKTLNDLEDFNKEIGKPESGKRRLSSYVVVFGTFVQLIVHMMNVESVFTLHIIYNINIFLIPIEYLLLCHVLNELKEQFVVYWTTNHQKLCTLAIKINKILTTVNICSLCYGLICTSLCGHYIAYSVRSGVTDILGGASITVTYLLFTEITFTLKNWTSVSLEVSIYQFIYAPAVIWD